MAHSKTEPTSAPRRMSPTAILSILLGIITAGTVGYRSIEGFTWLDSLYMTLITISTVGHGEPHPLTPHGRILTILLIVFGVGVAAVAVTRGFETLFQRQLAYAMRGKNMDKIIGALKEHTIVCGFGRMGQNIVAELLAEDESVVVIERDPERREELPARVLCVPGDANNEETLAKAGISRARALVCTLATDADNLFLTVTSRGLNPGLRIIARIEEERNRNKLIQAGASEVVSPFAAGAQEVVNRLTRPSVLQFLDLFTHEAAMKVQLQRVVVREDDPFCDAALAGGKVRQQIGGMVVAIVREGGERIFDPGPHTTVHAEDTLFVIGAVDGEERGSI